MTLYLLGAFLLSMVCGAVFTPAILDFCKRKKLYDLPNSRKVHAMAVPRMGGISFFPSMVLGFAVCLIVIASNDGIDHPLTIWSASYLVGLAIIYVTGIVDDMIGLNASTKFMAQICAASLLPLSGLYINDLYGLFGIYAIPAYIGVPLTVFMIVFVINAINLIDGIDGLAGSLSLLALGGFLTYFIHYDVFMNTYAILAAGMMGALIVFLYFNLFGKPERNTKIFMGDSGSLSLGYTLGFLAIKCTMDVDFIWPYRPEALLVPITLLFVPAADVVRVTFYRLYHHLPVFNADKNHIHHKLMQTGLNQHQTLSVILLYTLAIWGLNLLLHPTLSVTAILAADVLAYCLVNICINLLIKAKR